MMRRPKALAKLQETTLQSESREDLYQRIVKKPGITVGELRKETSRGWGALYHHLVQLEMAGLVRRVIIGRRTLLYPNDESAAETHAGQRAYLQGETARRLACALVREQPSSVPDLGNRTNQSLRVVYYHVRQMFELGLVTSPSRTRYFKLQATPLLASLVAKISEERR